MSTHRNPGDTWVTAADGNKYWGAFGAAGLLVHDPQTNSLLIQHRSPESHHGGTWGVLGGARHENESALRAALRESAEEGGVPAELIIPRYAHTLDKGGWTYTTILATAAKTFTPEIKDKESLALEWLPLAELDNLRLHPGFAATLPHLLPYLGTKTTVIVDMANVIGSVPDGWWHDRRGATERLRDRISTLATAETGCRAGFVWQAALQDGITEIYPDWLCVTEGQARNITGAPGITVIPAEGLGDDTIAKLASERTKDSAAVCVVTSDQELRGRVAGFGAHIRGAKKLLKLLG